MTHMCSFSFIYHSLVLYNYASRLMVNSQSSQQQLGHSIKLEQIPCPDAQMFHEAGQEPTHTTLRSTLGV